MSGYTEFSEFSSSDFRSLADIQEQPCLSVFIPKAEGDPNTSLARSAPALGDILRQARDGLYDSGMQSGEIHDFLAPLESLFAAGSSWHRVKQPLVAFCTPNQLRPFFVSVNLAPRVVVACRPFLKPLIPCLTRTRRYYVLAISDNAARLLHCSENNCVELPSEDLASSLKDVLTSRDFSLSLQGHTSKASGRPVLTYHGHSANLEDTRENRLAYCRQLDAAVRKVIGRSEEPLVLACVRELFFEFRQINSYPNLLPDPVSGNPDRLSSALLHEAAQEVIDSETTNQVTVLLSNYREVQDTYRASSDPEVILEAALQGRIRTVFTAEDAEIWGTFDRSGGTLRMAIGSEAPQREEFLNLIALETVRHGGLVYSLPIASMPSGKPVAALFRY